MTSSHQPPNKPHEPLHIPLHARLLQCRHVLFPALHGDHHPGVAGGHELAVHHEAGGHGIGVQRCVHGVADIDLMPAVTHQIRSLHDTRPDAWLNVSAP